jgi:hypothetical protein
MYSKQFMPLRLQRPDNTPLLTFYQKAEISSFLAENQEMVRPLLERREVRELLERAGAVPDNGHSRAAMSRLESLGLPKGNPCAEPSSSTLATSLTRLGTEHDEVRRERIDRNIADVAELLRVARAAESPAISSEISRLVQEKMENLVTESAQLQLKDSEGTKAVTRAHGYAAARPLRRMTATMATPDPTDVIVNLLKSEIGYLFFDRTRIRPSGFAVGEHLYALSLAPGEEVVLEQKTFSKRQLTYEEQTEEERQKDLELSSTLSTELQEGAERQRNRTNSAGFTAGGSVGGNIYGVEVSANLGYSTNLTEANRPVLRRSKRTPVPPNGWPQSIGQRTRSRSRFPERRGSRPPPSGYFAIRIA